MRRSSTARRRRGSRTPTSTISRTCTSRAISSPQALWPTRFRGLSILRTDEATARRLKEADPAVRAGRFSLRVMSWKIPAGAVSFAPARFPHSIAEAMS